MAECGVICKRTDEELNQLLNGPQAVEMAIHMSECPPCDEWGRTYMERVKTPPGKADAPLVALATQPSSGVENFLRRHFYC